MTLSQTLRAWRGADAGNGRGEFSQRAAAAHIGVPHKTYIDWEQSRRVPAGLTLESILQKISTEPKTSSSAEKRRPARAARVTKKATGTRASTRGGKNRVTNEKTKRHP